MLERPRAWLRHAVIMVYVNWWLLEVGQEDEALPPVRAFEETGKRRQVQTGWSSVLKSGATCKVIVAIIEGLYRERSTDVYEIGGNVGILRNTTKSLGTLASCEGL